MGPDPHDPLVFLDGAFLPAAAARVRADDLGFLYGDGLFETFRLVGGRPERLDAHLARMAASARFLEIPVTLGQVEMAAVVMEVARRNGHLDGGCRITVTRGPGGSPGYPYEAGPPTILVRTRSGTGYAPEEVSAGVDVVMSPVRQNADSPLPRHKTTAYLERLWARREAAGRGAREAILLDTRGQVAEGTSTNVFVVRGGVVRTPSAAGTILPGITRAVVLHLCRARGIPCLEEDLGPADLEAAEELFLTNALAGVLPVARLDGRRPPRGAPGPVTRAVRAAYDGPC